MNEPPNTPKAYIAGIGMVTSVGADAPATAAAVNAEISGYSASEYTNQSGQPITMANVPDGVFSDFPLAVETGDYFSDYADRMIKMSLMAIHEAMTPALAGQTFNRFIPLVLALSEAQTGIEQIDHNLLLGNLIENGNIPLNRELLYRTYAGRAGAIQGLDIAFRYLYELNYDFVLIGGSECYLNHPRLDMLDGAGRLLAPGVKDGFAPGEGAGFLLLTRQPHHALSRHSHIIALHPPGISEEPAHIHASEEQIYRGDGLDQAFKGALKDHSGTGIRCTYSSMNGEHYWAKEFGVALLRNQAHFHDPTSVAHPADCFGDLGAATGPALIGLAAMQLLQQPGLATHLVYGSADGPMRAAVRVEKIAQPPNPA